MLADLSNRKPLQAVHPAPMPAPPEHSLSQSSRDTSALAAPLVRRKGKPRVVIADDEHIIADTLKMILVQHGYDVRVAYSGDEALALIRDFHPDLLISDVVMPGINGVEAAMATQTAHPDCAVLLFSGQAGILDLVNESRQLGYTFELLSKPLHPHLLLAHIRRSLHGKL